VCNEDQAFFDLPQACIYVLKSCVFYWSLEERILRAIALAALEALRYQSPDALLLVVTADMKIRDVAAFELAVAQAIALASNGGLVTFGLCYPTRPETGLLVNPFW